MLYEVITEYDKSLLDTDDSPTASGQAITVTLDYSTLQEKFASSSSYLKYHSILSVSVITSYSIHYTKLYDRYLQ